MSTTTNNTGSLPVNPLLEQPAPTTPDVCDTNDKECIARLVQAMSDCE